MLLDIRPDHLKIVQEILERIIPDREVWAFGSRVKGTAKGTSDLDLVVIGENPLDFQTVGGLREAFSESNIPYKVDMVDWATIGETFREIIRKDKVVIQKGVTNDLGNQNKHERDYDRKTAGEWRTVRIEEIAEKVSMGPFGSSIKVETFVPAGIPVISGQHLQGSRVCNTREFNFITPEHAERLKNAMVQRGDIVFTHAGNIGQVAYIPDNSKFDRYMISQRQFFMRCDRSKVIPEFVVAYFKTPEGQHKLLANRSQVGVPSIARPVTYLRTIKIPLPPFPEQRAIAHILGTLDDKIELNRRMNETLEAMVRAIFKSWFVDFDPVRAKVEGRPTGLPKEISDLFPDGFEDSELGEIPRGWKIGKLGDLIAQRVERTTPGVETRSLPYVPVECITSKNIFLSQSLSGQEANSSLVKFYKGDILFGAMRSYFHKVCVAPFDGTTRTTAFVLIPKEQEDQYFCLFSLFQEETIEFATNHSEGSTIPYAKWIGSLETKETVIPPRSLRNSFQNVAAGFIEAGINQVNESISIFQIRDIILPKLLSGEISVTDYMSSVDGGPLEARCNQDSDGLNVPNATTRRAMEEAEEIVRTKRARRKP